MKKNANTFWCRGCGSSVVTGRPCDSCGTSRARAQALRLLIASPNLEEEPVQETNEETREEERQSPSVAMVRNSPAEGMGSFFLACKAAIWVGIITVSMVLLFFVGVVAVAVYNAM